MKTNKLLMVFALILFSSMTFAQGYVKGIIQDASTGEGLVGANVIIEGTTTGTTADLDGSFLLKTSAGSQSIVVKYIGYQDYTTEVSIVNGETKDLGVVKLKSSAIGLNEINVLADIAIDRKTPVAVSTVKTEEIEERLGGRDLPTILNLTPSVYAAPTGGGYGDARVNIRGFNQRNVAVMINGIPVNDMENGWVYWSNWAGLGDATSTIQVQRGLSASKLAINSIGGTMNIITKTTDIKKGGSIKTSVTDYGMFKTMLSLSTGQLESGTAVQFVGSRTFGEGYIDGTWMDAWSYYLAVSQVINDKHRLAFTLVGAPQKHGQRRDEMTKEEVDYYGSTYNSQWGWFRGEQISERVNQYHKPQMALNWYWDINDKSFLATSAYYSTGTGYGSGPLSSQTLDGSGGYDRNYNVYDSRGQIDYNYIIDDNASHQDTLRANHDVVGGFSKRILRNSVNNHSWYGLLSTLTHKFTDELTFMAGIDARSYKGEHYREVRDLLGGDYYYEEYKYAVDGIAGRNQIMQVGDKIAYDNDGLVRYGGAFAQLEYAAGNFAVFATGTLSNTWYKRIDRYNYITDQESETVSQLGYNFKLGANYNLSEKSNLFVNGGYYSKAPDFRFLWPNYTNVLSTDNLVNEVVLGLEGGYGFKSRFFSLNLNAYYTQWKDKSLLTRPYMNADGVEIRSFITGLDANHSGVELEAMAAIARNLRGGLIASIGNWEWANDVSATVTDDQTQEQYETNLYIKGLKVGNQPQTQVGIKLDYTLFQDIDFGLEVIYYDKMYADFAPEDYQDPEDRAQAWQIPSFTMTNFYMGYRFQFAGLDSWAGANVYNVFDVDYWAEGTDGSDHNEDSFRGYKGYGRNMNFSVKVNF